MDGFSAVDCNVVSSGRGGDSRSFLDTDLQYKWSKSAVDKKSDSAHETSRSIEKDPNVSKDLGNLVRCCETESPIYPDCSDSIDDTLTSHRASLENDIEQLQLCLHQEKSMRTMLERAIGRSSCTLSPGNRQLVAQTRELIQEIELLEEEVANRERHVLSLYRNIFDQCLSRTLSGQSSLMTSPAHIKNEVRKHPSIISSTFCSSKKFSLQPFQLLGTKKDSGKKNTLQQSKARHSILDEKTNIHIDSNSSDPAKVPEKVHTVGKNSLPVRTLKDHLYQCPSKLSEELVRCMAAMYCWVCNGSPVKPENGCVPLESRSSTKVALPRQSVGGDQDCSWRSTMEISRMLTDGNQHSRASYATSSYRVLVEQLERVNPSHMETDAKLAFWINVYNSLVMHAYLVCGIPIRSMRRMVLFQKAGYNIGGHIISANSIEHSILCCHSQRIGHWFETILLTAMRRKSGEERQLVGTGFGLSNSQPLVCFALCNGASSDPMMRVYTASNVKEELEIAKNDYLQANVVVKKSSKVLLPRILERYSKEASISTNDLFSWVCDNVDKQLCDAIKKCIDSKSNRKSSHIMEWLPYDMRFQYVFASDLTEKPWWL
ncbi:hypothetical protein MRB53_027069 [Persea americana]|uniref:Uncharacterized protein n=1 Tax=Persea americana TaxID=3435 RepID=A0ACC2LKN6_PERAE|nr:hypothetical protein MRB53_027069 [Persea americana]